MRDQQLYLRDIFAATVALQEFVEDMDFEAFAKVNL